MKNSFPNKIKYAALGLAAVSGMAMGAPGDTSTGQGIMVNIIAPTSIVRVGHESWNFDADAAKTLFTNAWNGNPPTVSCAGGGCPGVAPTAPAAPAPDASKVSQGLVQASKCSLWDGEPIAGNTYTQTAKRETVIGSKKATYTYTFTYNLAAATQVARTAWDLKNISGDGDLSGLVRVMVDADIAGQSVQSSKQHPKKYSFSLDYSYVDEFGVAQTGNRVTDLVVSLNKGTESEISVAATSTMIFPVDFTYVTNAGTNGNTTLLANGDARTILNTDSHAGNDNGGADGRALALAEMQPVTFDVPVGAHTFTLTGTVKGNSATATSAVFSVSQTIKVHAESCQND